MPGINSKIVLKEKNKEEEMIDEVNIEKSWQFYNLGICGSLYYFLYFCMMLENIQNYFFKKTIKLCNWGA